MGKNPNISAETREKRRQAALKLAEKGKFGFSKTMFQRPFDAPGTTKTIRAVESFASA
jgi:hypothetical protein